MYCQAGDGVGVVVLSGALLPSSSSALKALSGLRVRVIFALLFAPCDW